MFKSLGLFSVMAAASVALAACEQKPAEGPPADTTALNDTANAAADANAVAAITEGSATGGKCGGFGDPPTCSTEGDFCKKPMGKCDTADAQGTCTKPPEICPRDYVPVCGCDGKDYANACEADKAGVNVQADGKCQPKG